MAEFAYNNIKNACISHILFELNYLYYYLIFYKKDVNSYFKSQFANKLTIKSSNLMTVYKKVLNILKNYKNNIRIKLLSLKTIP